MQRFLSVGTCLAYATASSFSQGRQLNENVGGFLNKAINKGCCTTGACGCIEVSATPLQLNLHEHSYCHLDTTPKYARKTVWMERKVQGTRPVMVKKFKKMKKTVIDYKLKEVPSIKHGTKVIKRTRTRDVNANKVIFDLVPENTVVRKLVKRMVDEVYEVNETRYRTEDRDVEKVKMVPQIITVQDVRWNTSTVQQDVSKWVDKPTLAKVRVPKIPANAAPMLNKAAPACACFKAKCDCAGQAGCGCCAPACDCAPAAKASLQKMFETVQVLTTSKEEVISKMPVVTKTPVLFDRKVSIMVPKTFIQKEKIQVPFLFEVKKTRQVPTLVMEDTVEVVMRRVPRNVAFAQVEEFTVDETVPYSEPVTTQVQVPFTRESEVTVEETVAEQQAFTLVIKEPKETIEKLPASTVCHEHKYQHSHALSPGETHTHSEEHSHPHAGDGSDFEGRIIEPSSNPVLSAGEAKKLGGK